MLESVSPDLVYYLLLYFLTFVLRAIRCQRSGAAKITATFLGLELVNVAAGVFVILTRRADGLAAPILIIYVILVIVGFYLEDAKMSDGRKASYHIIISLAVLGATAWAFSDYKAPVKSVRDGGIVATASPARWRVALPYIDASLNRTLAVKGDALKSIYATEVVAEGRDDAIAKAKLQFYSSAGPLPFVPKNDKTDWSMIVSEGSAVAERIGPANIATAATN